MTYVSAVMVENGITVLSDGRRITDNKINKDDVKKFVNDAYIAICWSGKVDDKTIDEINKFVLKDRTLLDYNKLIDKLFKITEATFMICNSKDLTIIVLSNSYEDRVKETRFSEAGGSIVAIGGHDNQNITDEITSRLYAGIKWNNDLNSNLNEQKKVLEKIMGIESDTQNKIGGETFSCKLKHKKADNERNETI